MEAIGMLEPSIPEIAVAGVDLLGVSVLGISLDTAKNIAIVVVIVFLLGGVLAAWLMKTIIQKIAVAIVLGLLAFAVWSQRTSLQDCADKVTANFELEGTDATLVDTECSFFGFTVTISDPRGDA